MLSETTIKDIADVLGITAEDFTAKLNSEQDEALSIPEGEFFTEDQLTKRDNAKYRDGKSAGAEMLVKDLKKKYGYELDGKDIDTFLDHHDGQLKTKYSKGNDQKVIDLENDLKKQKKTYDDEIGTWQSKYESIEEKYKRESVKNRLLAIMPKETTIKRDAIVTLFNSEYSTIVEDSKEYVVKNGEKLKDSKTAEALSLESVFNEFVVSEGYSKGNSGRGQGDDYGNGTKTYKAQTVEQFQEEWQNKNPDKSLMSDDYANDYAQFRKDNAA